LRSGKCDYRLDPAEAATGLSVSAGGDVLVWRRKAADGCEVHVRRHPSGEERVLRGLPDDSRFSRWFDNHPCASPDGRWLVVPSEEGTLRRWDLTSGKELPALAEAQRTVWELFWSPDGRLVGTRGSAAQPGVRDREARQHMRLWDVATGKRLAHLEMPGASGCLLFGHDGRTLLTTDAEAVLHHWEVLTGKERRRLAGHLPAWVGALALAPDGRTLASGGYDGQVLVWDLTGRAPDGKWQTTRHTPDHLGALWDDLAGEDAVKAGVVVWSLVADPEGTTAFLRERLRPVESPDVGRLRRWIADLDNDTFAVRERAERELEAMAEAAGPELRQALERVESAEARRRLRRLIDGLEESVPAGRQLQALRGIEVLEHVGTPEARDILRGLAGGAAAARLTREARASLRRLEGQAALP
jgi:hypothetical protein